MQTAMGFARIRPPRIAMGLLAAAIGLHGILPATDAVGFSSPVAGAAAGVAGFGLMMWAWFEFRLKGIPVCPRSASGTMAADGPFRISRNPMYLGMTAMLLGVALWMGTLQFYAAVLIFSGIMNWVFIPLEERMLEKEFGAEYIRYKNRVRRWI